MCIVKIKEGRAIGKGFRGFGEKITEVGKHSYGSFTDDRNISEYARARKCVSKKFSQFELKI